jgi:hypothetical protein
MDRVLLKQTGLRIRERKEKRTGERWKVSDCGT